MVTTGSRYSLFAVGLLATALTACIVPGAQADLFVSSDSNGLVAQYDENDGTFLSVFASGTGGPRGILWGPDGNLYVASGNNIQRFDSSGNFIDTFVQGGAEMSGARGIIFGRDGNLYVASKNNNS